MLDLAYRPWHAKPVAFASYEVTLDFMDADGDPIQPQHYAFLVGEAKFEQIFGRIRSRA